MLSSSFEVDNHSVAEPASLLNEYLAQLSLGRVAGSTTRRLASALVNSGLDLLIGNHPLIFPVKCAANYLASGYAKSFAVNLIDGPSEKEDEFVIIESGNPEMLDVPEEDLEDFFVIERDPQNTSREAKQTSWEQGKILLVSIKDGIQSCITEITPEQIMAGTFGTAGSVAVTGALVLIAGPPGWVALPLHMVLEGGTKSFSAFLGRWCSQQFWGEDAKKPLFQQGQCANNSDLQQSIMLCLNEYSKDVEEAIQVKIYEDMVQQSSSGMYFSSQQKSGQPVLKLNLIENYDPSLKCADPERSIRHGK